MAKAAEDASDITDRAPPLCAYIISRDTCRLQTTPVTTFAFPRLRHSLPLIAAVLLLLSQGALAAVPSISSESNVLVDEIDAAITAIEAQEDLDEENQGRILEQLRDARSQLENQAAAERDTASFKESMESAPGEIESLTAELNKPAQPAPTPESLGVTDQTELRELEQILTRESAALDSTNARLAQLEADIQSTGNRPAEARARIDELRSEISDLDRAREEAPPPGETKELTDARVLAAELRLRARRAELERLEQELASQSVRVELLRVQRDLASRQQDNERQRVEMLTSLVNDKRRSSAEDAQSEALEVEQEFRDSHPAVREIAAGNAELTGELPAVAEDIADASEELTLANQKSERIERALARSEQRLRIAGISQAIGRLLLEERRSLPRVSQYRQEVRDRRKTLAEIGLAQVRIDEQRRELTPISRSVTATMQDVAADIDDPTELAEIQEQIRTLLISRRDLLQSASHGYTSYLAALSDLDVAQRRLLVSAAEYKRFLDRHLIWIPSATPVSLDTIKDSGPSLAWALSPAEWGDVWTSLVQSLRERLLLTILGILAIAALLWARPRLIQRQVDINTKVGRLSTDSIWLTIQALIIVTLRVLPLPLAFGFAGLALQYGPDQSGFTISVATALLAVSPFLYHTTVFRALCENKGVAHVHFGVKPRSLDIIRRQLDFLTAFGVPLVFTTVLYFAAPEPAYRDSLGRLFFVALMIVLALVLHPLEHPRHGIAGAYFDRDPGSRMSRLRWLWYVLAVGGPISLGLLALSGFLYTAGMLIDHLIDTIWLILTLTVINLSVLRWLALERRKIAWQAAVEKREARRTGEDQAQAAAGATAEGDAPVIESQPLDLEAVDLQMRRLLRAFLLVVGIIAAYGIWSDILPALKILNEVTLWSNPTTVDGVATLKPVTLADAVLALVILVATFIASKNLPGLTEIAILQHLDLQPGSRYTINTLLRYFVVTIGVIAVLNIVGLPWSRIQWLVAALSVGLGFGLQEIVANFVSGLIILFERPVRVGDTVTVGNLSGTVSRVRIRATTITDWDRKEIVVPNKEFITSQVINWTLSDPITRIVIQVGVSYGTDAKLAHKVMEETLRANPLILDEPEPRAYFMGFGDSSLDFKLYMYSRQLGDRFPIMHSVHEDILEALRKNDIEIPFPQRDLHVRSSVDLPIGGGAKD